MTLKSRIGSDASCSKNVLFEETAKTEMEFPSITFCPLNAVDRGKKDDLTGHHDLTVNIVTHSGHKSAADFVEKCTFHGGPTHIQNCERASPMWRAFVSTRTFAANEYLVETLLQALHRPPHVLCNRPPYIAYIDPLNALRTRVLQ